MVYLEKEELYFSIVESICWLDMSVYTDLSDPNAILNPDKGIKMDSEEKTNGNLSGSINL